MSSPDFIFVYPLKWSGQKESNFLGSQWQQLYRLPILHRCLCPGIKVSSTTLNSSRFNLYLVERLSPETVVHEKRLELSTYRLKGGCSCQLSYSCIWWQFLRDCQLSYSTKVANLSQFSNELLIYYYISFTHNYFYIQFA